MFGVPGIGADITNFEAQIFWGGDASKVATWFNGHILSSTVDSNNTPTTVLRPGLVLGRITASGKLKQYDPTASDGSEIAIAVLAHELRMTDFNGTAFDRQIAVAVGGQVRGGRLIESGASSDTLGQIARAQMHGRFLFDDDLIGNRMPFVHVLAKTADYTVLVGDNNKIFTNQGATGIVIFTLPTVARGLRYRFFAEADFDMRVASAVGDIIVAFNDATADAVYFSETDSEVIGGAIEMIANADGTKWLTFLHLGFESQTVTIVT